MKMMDKLDNKVTDEQLSDVVGGTFGAGSETNPLDDFFNAYGHTYKIRDLYTVQDPRNPDPQPHCQVCGGQLVWWMGTTARSLETGDFSRYYDVYKCNGCERVFAKLDQQYPAWYSTNFMF